MKISYKWLKEFVELDLSPADLAEKFTMAGLELESMENLSEGLEPVVVAQVVKKEQHPNADRLSVCQVSVGAEELEIVCGATNFKEGDKVVLARSGTVLPGGFKLKKSKIRGVVSNGMMCSERELQIGTDASGIIILPEDAPVGTPLIEYFDLDDIIFDLNVTPNRPDWLSVVGVAREIAAVLGKEVKIPAYTVGATDAPAVGIEIDNEQYCPRYTGCCVGNVKVGPSPMWMQNRLRNVGLRPINNVVDITNYVLLEFGQPLHAFDASKLEGGKIVVRAAQSAEKVVSLDGKERELDENMTVIADGAKAVAIAGVMGLENTEISDDSTDVFLESAYFNPPRTRYASKKLGLSSDSSYRFERGVDLGMVKNASARAVTLMEEICGAKALSCISEVGAGFDNNPDILLRSARVRLMLGFDIAADTVTEILNRLGFGVEQAHGGFNVKIPSYRKDVTNEADLVEEIARIYGYNSIESGDCRQKVSFDPGIVDKVLADELKDALAGLGLYETVHYSFASHELARKNNLIDEYDPESVITILNPINKEAGDMRNNLIEGTCRCLQRNFSRGQDNVRVFEFGKVFWKDPKAEFAYCEKRCFSIGIMSARPDKQFRNDPEIGDFLDLKGIVEVLMNKAGIKNYGFEAAKSTAFAPGRFVNLLVNGVKVGFFGELDKKVIKKNDLMGKVSVGQFDLTELEKHSRLNRTYTPVSRFPASARDLAFVVDESVCWGDIEQQIQNLGISYLAGVHLFDEYKGDQIPEGKKSLAFGFKFQSDSATLTKEEVDLQMEKIVSCLSSKFNCEIRVS